LISGTVLPGQKPTANVPAISIRRLLLLAKIDPVVEQIKGSVTAVKMLLGGLDREPDPVHEEQAEEDCHRKPEIVLQQFRVVDVREHGEDHADRGEEPEEPSFGEDLAVGIFDHETRHQEIRAALLDAWNYGNPTYKAHCQ
jgi:hypothetical protein